MGMIVDGPRRAAQVLGHLRILDEQFPAASLFADTPLAPGQRCVLIAAGVAVSYAQSSVPGRLDPIGGGEPVLVGQNSDGSVRVTDADGGNPRVGALRVFAHAPAPAPVPEVKDHGPSEMTGP